MSQQPALHQVDQQRRIAGPQAMRSAQQNDRAAVAFRFDDSLGENRDRRVFKRHTRAAGMIENRLALQVMDSLAQWEN
ncbi:MAG: hypothetical protein FD138_3312, partial [Planctomycetota bacterium]